MIQNAGTKREAPSKCNQQCVDVTEFAFFLQVFLSFLFLTNISWNYVILESK
jgi:hypothetical protein